MYAPRRSTNVRPALIIVAAAFVYSTAASSSAEPPKDPEAVDLTVLKYSELEAAIREHKGKIVVVDV